MVVNDIPVMPFRTIDEWEKWLEKNHTNSSGIWVKFFKKNSGVQTITYAEALDVALCYGWIDSQLKGYDDKAYLQKFTPRKSKSVWSKTNIGHIDRLIKAGKMRSAGLQLVEEAKKDGTWSQAYDSAKTMVIPDDFMNELSKDKRALEFFKTLNKTNLYAIGWRLQTARTPETRVKRMTKILELLSKGKKLHE